MSLARLISLSVQERRGIFTPEKRPPQRWPKYIDEKYVPWIRDAFKANNEIKVGALIQINAGRLTYFLKRADSCLGSRLSKHHEKSKRPETGEAE